jgi:hypothetical protein
MSDQEDYANIRRQFYDTFKNVHGAINLKVHADAIVKAFEQLAQQSTPFQEVAQNAHASITNDAKQITWAFILSPDSPIIQPETQEKISLAFLPRSQTIANPLTEKTLFQVKAEYTGPTTRFLRYSVAAWARRGKAGVSDVLTPAQTKLLNIRIAPPQTATKTITVGFEDMSILRSRKNTIPAASGLFSIEITPPVNESAFSALEKLDRKTSEALAGIRALSFHLEIALVDKAGKEILVDGQPRKSMAVIHVENPLFIENAAPVVEAARTVLSNSGIPAGLADLISTPSDLDQLITILERKNP